MAATGDGGGGSARRDLGGLAEVCYELSDTEWALPTECPGWDVKDLLSHLIGIERSLMGEPAPSGTAPRRAREERLRRHERAVGRRAAPAARPSSRAEFVEVTATRLDELEAPYRGPVGRGRLEPGRRRPYAVFMEVRVFDSWVHEQDTRCALDRPAAAGTGPRRWRSTGCRAPCPSWSASGPPAPTAPRSASRSRARGDDARTFTVAVEGGRARPRRRRAPTPSVTLSLSSIDSCVSAVGGSPRRKWRRRAAVAFRGDAVSAAPCSPR